MEPITAKGSVNPPTSYSAPPTTGPTISPAEIFLCRLKIFFSSKYFSRTNSKEELDHGEHGGDLVWELPGDGGEASSQEHRVAASLEYPEDEGHAQKNFSILKQSQTAVANQNQSHCSDTQI